MKKILFAFATATLLFACKNGTPEDGALVDEQLPTARKCESYEVLEQQIAADPERGRRLEQVEEFTNRVLANPNANRLLSNGIIEIPVVFNVLYRTTAQNVSLAQLQSQIDVLNADFAATNADYNLTPSIFQGVRSGDVGVRFVLDQVIRRATNTTSWTTNDNMKRANRGGINPTSPTTKLNIWVCNMGGGILGYAQFPGGSPATDGVVLDDNATGNTGTAAAPFNRGRTATHEVGHWLNLRHIWGDATCGNDQVADTPPHNASNGGCPTFPHLSTCPGNPVEMTMNYMDYTNDVCMYMFTVGQKNRMKATFVSGGPRNSFAQP
jgi:hypothetical protein